HIPARKIPRRSGGIVPVHGKRSTLVNLHPPAGNAVRGLRSSVPATSVARGYVPAEGHSQAVPDFRGADGSMFAAPAWSPFRRLHIPARSARYVTMRLRPHPRPGFRTPDASSPDGR